MVHAAGPPGFPPAHYWLILFHMPRYDYRCRTCETTFEASRPMSEANDSTPCPQGHNDSVKLLSTVSLSGAGVTSTETIDAGSGGGGCCGGGCCG